MDQNGIIWRLQEMPVDAIGVHQSKQLQDSSHHTTPSTAWTSLGTLKQKCWEQVESVGWGGEVGVSGNIVLCYWALCRRCQNPKADLSKLQRLWDCASSWNLRLVNVVVKAETSHVTIGRETMFVDDAKMCALVFGVRFVLKGELCCMCEMT